MRISIQILTLAAVALLAASSCTQDEVITPPPEQGGTPVEFTMGVRALSRTVTEGDVTDFVAGDEVGIFATGEEDGNTWTNERYGYDGNTWSGNITVYEGSSYNYCAYYPYNAQVTGTTSLFTVDTDQSGGYNHSDVLIATGTSDNANVTLNYDHAFAMVEVTLQPKDADVDINGAHVALANILPSASINLQTQEVGAASGTAGYVTMYPTGSNTYRAVVPAQSIAQGQDLLLITSADNSTAYRFVYNASVSYAQGDILRMIVTVSNDTSGEEPDSDPDPDDPDNPDPDDPDNPDPDDPDNPDPDDPDNPDPDDPDNPDPDDPDNPDEPDPEPEPEPDPGTAITIIVGEAQEIADWKDDEQGIGGKGEEYTPPTTLMDLSGLINADMTFTDKQNWSKEKLTDQADYWFVRWSETTTVSYDAVEGAIKAENTTARGSWNNTSFGYHAGEKVFERASYRLTFEAKSTIAGNQVYAVTVRSSADDKSFRVSNLNNGLRNMVAFNVADAEVNTYKTITVELDFTQADTETNVSNHDSFLTTTAEDVTGGISIYFFNNLNNAPSAYTTYFRNIKLEKIE